MGNVHKHSGPYHVSDFVITLHGYCTVHKHSGPYPVSGCVADNFTWVLYTSSLGLIQCHTVWQITLHGYCTQAQ